MSVHQQISPHRQHKLAQGHTGIRVVRLSTRSPGQKVGGAVAQTLPPIC